MNSIFEYGAIPLEGAGTVVSWRRLKVGRPGYVPMVVVMESAKTDDGVHTPASSVAVSGVEQLQALRAAIDEALKGEAK